MVQFCYGDDGLDPAMIEGEMQPIEFYRNLAHAIAVIPPVEDEPGLLPTELSQIVSDALSSERFKKGFSEAYLKQVSDFVHKEIVSKLIRLREKVGLSNDSADSGDRSGKQEKKPRLAK